MRSVSEIACPQDGLPPARKANAPSRIYRESFIILFLPCRYRSLLEFFLPVELPMPGFQNSLWVFAWIQGFPRSSSTIQTHFLEWVPFLSKEVLAFLRFQKDLTGAFEVDQPVLPDSGAFP